MSFYGWTADYVLDGITGAEGWVYYNWALENEAQIFGIKRERSSDGYVKQEWKRLMKQNGKRN